MASLPVSASKTESEYERRVCSEYPARLPLGHTRQTRRVIAESNYTAYNVGYRILYLDLLVLTKMMKCREVPW